MGRADIKLGRLMISDRYLGIDAKGNWALLYMKKKAYLILII